MINAVGHGAVATQLFDFKRPQRGASSSARRSAILQLDDPQHDAMYALAGCEDVNFLISNVQSDVRVAMHKVRQCAHVCVLHSLMLPFRRGAVAAWGRLVGCPWGVIAAGWRNIVIATCSMTVRPGLDVHAHLHRCLELTRRALRCGSEGMRVGVRQCLVCCHMALR